MQLINVLNEKNKNKIKLNWTSVCCLALVKEGAV